MQKQEEHFGYKFRRIHIAIDKYFSSCGEKEGNPLTRVQCITLHYLYHNRDRDIFQKDVESQFSISRATATNILKGMEKLGMIKRVPVEGDRRLKKIVLLQKGIKAEQRGHQNLLRVEECLVRGMSGEERALYGRLLDRTLRNIEELQDGRQQEKYSDYT